MRRWLLPAASVLVSILLIGFIVAKFQTLEDKKGDRLKSQPVPFLSKPAKESVLDSAKSVALAPPAAETSGPGPIAPSGGWKASDFIEESLEVIEAYRESNRGFLAAEGIQGSFKARHQFERVHSMAVVLEDADASQKELKELLMQASQLRVQGSEFILKIFQEPASDLTEWRWEESLSMLKQANRTITEAAQRLVDLIDFHGGEIGEELKDSYLRSLSEAVKGILVVSRSSP